MPLRHRLRAPFAVLLVASLLAAPAPVAATDPTLGDPVSLPDGTVLPEIPADQLRPSVHAEMGAEYGGGSLQTTDSTIGVDTALEDAGGIVQAAEPLTLSGGVAGPAGPLPNGLRREVLGFLPHWKLDGATAAATRLDLVSTIAYFSIDVQSNGYLARGTSAQPTAGWSRWNSAAMTERINAAHARGVRVVPTITMMAWNKDYTAMTTLLNSATNRGRLVNDVVAMVRDRRVDGVNIDFEPVPSTLRAQFTTLVRQIKAGLVNAKVGSYVTVDTMAGAATWSTGYDVVGLTATGAADALMVMAYDFHYAGSARAGAVAPIDSDYIFASADALRDHLARVSPRKLIWGVPYYGTAWNTTTSNLNSPVRSPVQSVAFSYYWNDGGKPAGGKVLAQRFGRKWDPIGQVPWFSFWDAGSGGYRQGYYDDPASLRIKYDMVLKHNLAGIGIWHLGMDTGVPDLWNVLEDRFSKVRIRLAGANRYETAAAISRSSFGAGVPVAYVATGSSFPDALAGGPAASKAGGPVLLVTKSELPAATAGELARLKPARIVVLGGTSVVSDAVLTRLRPYTGGGVTRLAGADRYATAARVSAASFGENVPVAYVATGASFPDALAGGVAAGRQKGPVLLVAAGSVPSATAAELRRLKPKKIVVLGGPSVVSDAVATALRPYTGGGVTRLAGADRYATAIAISKATTGTDAPRTVYVATGASFPDGLAGTPAAARANGPLLIVPPGGLTDALRAELRRLNPPRIVILGGPSVVSAGVVSQIAALWD